VDTVDEQAVIDLLGVLSYAELTAFDRLAEDARLAPTLDGRAALAQMAAA
jgi:1,2-phenylacetyl-CoA epoxidase catalytic subunit